MRDDETLRADARRNRDAILTAARKVLASRGQLVPLSEIAAEAGVGRATLQRRFATREELILELIRQNMDLLEELADDLDGVDDALVRLLTATAQTIADGQAFVDFFYRPEISIAYRREFASRLKKLFTPALERGQRAGLLRADLDSDDVVILADMLVGSLGHHTSLDDDVSYLVDRTLALVLHSIRTT
ncbi:TetR/AcrR family transcriptional regulator [Rhodococcus qingshengii]|uniref:TetR/AcrR family transcriptional regulator n=1 Tax=Rhodococcus qingshengii TaxID=334542 RepID=UPI001BE816C1|nr:TetR/AcrR family transcriptional regulator [Rhodococcus qingshengii]MBT2272278.1 TetR/AcrR family transcriptional regulator [Rhodococcus qingshengii]